MTIWLLFPIGPQSAKKIFEEIIIWKKRGLMKYKIIQNKNAITPVLFSAFYIKILK